MEVNEYAAAGAVDLTMMTTADRSTMADDGPLNLSSHSLAGQTDLPASGYAVERWSCDSQASGCLTVNGAARGCDEPTSQTRLSVA